MYGKGRGGMGEGGSVMGIGQEVMAGGGMERV